jgi:hypothetical protein
MIRSPARELPEHCKKVMDAFLRQGMFPEHLRELGAPEPQMPPFDKGRYEPVSEVEINPKDEFYVEEEK